MRCLKNRISPHEYEWTCFSCGYNVMKRKKELAKIKGKKIYQPIKIFLK